ncbi:MULTISPECIES: hypothetical protein [unclassified Sinorhizobium]|uniref:hypothetical protein n=1 Tax=unclassified Sinorhizobium TaxID=2613772 RepID=UPI0024C23EF7|nr:MULTISPECIES: hypothetical protein [unclassified Sinorhizobium]MDK1372953.1 hypothetical protein [Sinorhizobium sp. 6-70]MDK1477491.1 hypothetical protein [Sinorhizobium sp. 6-117]
MTAKELYRLIKGLEAQIDAMPLADLEMKVEALERARGLFEAKPITRQTEAIVAFAAGER